MSKKKNQANKEISHGNQQEDIDEESIDEGLEDEDLGLEEGNEVDFDELEQGVKANVDARAAAIVEKGKLSVDTQQTKSAQAPQRLVSPGAPAGSQQKSVLTGLRDQAASVFAALKDESDAKLVRARDHVQQAVTWLDDFLGKK